MSELMDIGCEVEQAENGGLALEIARNSSDLKLVISDVRMPKMGGIELFEKILELKKDITLILMTGFSDQELPQLIKDSVFAAFPKPYDFDLFEETVAKAMNPKRD